MTKIVEKNVAAIIMIALFSVILFSSCSGPAHCAGNNWATSCPAYK